MPDESSEAPKTQKKIKVDVIGYESDRLTFEYNGEIQTYEVWDNVFSPMGGTKAASLIFNNRYGEKIPASIKLNPENTRVVSCDLLLERFNGFFNDPESLKLSKEDRVMKMEKTDETHIRLYNKIRSIEADTAILIICIKANTLKALPTCLRQGTISQAGLILQIRSHFCLR